MKCTFSVLITNFNYELYVVEAIESALKQTLAPDEIIIVDDGSTDDSVALLQDKYGANEKIKILTQKNSGQLAAFSTGLSAARGEFVAFLDADDWWDETHLARLLEIFCGCPEVDVVLTSLRVIGAPDRGACFHAGTSYYQKKIYPGVLSCWVSIRGHYRGWLGSATSGICAKRSAARLAMPPYEYFLDWVTCADNPLIFGLAINGAVFEFASNPTVNYRVHGVNNWYGRRSSAVSNFKNELRHQKLFRARDPGHGLAAAGRPGIGQFAGGCRLYAKLAAESRQGRAVQPAGDFVAPSPGSAAGLRRSATRRISRSGFKQGKI